MEMSVFNQGEGIGWHLIEEGMNGGLLQEVFELEEGGFAYEGLVKESRVGQQHVGSSSQDAGFG